MAGKANEGIPGMATNGLKPRPAGGTPASPVKGGAARWAPVVVCTGSTWGAAGYQLQEYQSPNELAVQLAD